MTQSINIILFYQHKVRELDACLKLKDKISEIKSTCNVAIMQIDFEWHQAIKYAKHHRIDCIGMPWLYHDNNYALLEPFIKLNPEIVIINLHQEQIVSTAFEKNILPATNLTKNGCYHFCWGSLFAKKLLSCGVQEDLIKCVGNMRLDDLVVNKNLKNSKSVLAERYSLDINKKWIVFAENRGNVYKLDKATFHEYEEQGVSRKDIQEKKQIGLASMEIMFSQMEALGAIFFDDFELIYRPHPGTLTPLSDGDYNVRVISDEAISDWLSCCDLVLIWNSTVAFEAELAGVPVLRHEPISDPLKLIPFGIEKFPIIKDLSSINQEMISSQKSEQQGQKVYESVYGKVDGRATERTAESFLTVLKQGMPSPLKVSLTYGMKRSLFKKRVFELVVFLLNKWGFVERFKWPKSAYSQLADIPSNLK